MKSTLFCAALSTVGLASILWASQPNQAPRIDTASCAGKAGCTVSFELIDNRIFVPVWINGQGPFHILFDTGAGAGVSMEVAEKLKLPHESDIEGGGVGSGTIKGYSSHLKSAAIGARASGERASVEDIEIEVLPLNDSPAVFGKVPLDGFMGFPFYEKYVIEHDYTAKKLTFRDPRTFTYSGHGVQLDIESTSYVPLVDGTLDGMPGKFGIDTGARSSLLLYGPYVASHGLREKYKPKFEGVTGWGIGGPVRSEIARIGGVGLGGIEIHDVVARFSLNKSGATAGSSKAGLIGPDILKQFTLICDYSRKKLILEKNKDFGRRDTYDKAGVWLTQSGDEFEVLDVIAGGPAEKAGLHVGDRIISLDGKSVAGIVLPELRDNWKYADAGTKIDLRVQTASGIKDLTLVLAEMV